MRKVLMLLKSRPLGCPRNLHSTRSTRCVIVGAGADESPRRFQDPRKRLWIGSVRRVHSEKPDFAGILVELRFVYLSQIINSRSHAPSSAPRPHPTFY